MHKTGENNLGKDAVSARDQLQLWSDPTESLKSMMYPELLPLGEKVAGFLTPVSHWLCVG